MEIERKFLVRQLPDIDTEEIWQGYISRDPEVRIRKYADTYTITIKSQGDLSREEHEMQITENQFKALRDKVDPGYICKHRGRVKLDEHVAEVDVYHDELKGLMTVEVEFDSLEEAKEFSPPEWFGEEITYDEDYKNKNLSVARKMKVR